MPHRNTSGLLKILLWTHTSLPQSAGVKLLIQSNHWCPALLAYLSVLIAFLMPFKWGNIKPCHVNLPQVGCWMEWVRRPFSAVGTGVQQTPYWNLFLLVWFVNHGVVPDGPAPPRALLAWRKTLSAGLLRSELALAAGELPDIWQHAAAEVSLSSPWLPPRHSLAIPVGLLLSTLE